MSFFGRHTRHKETSSGTDNWPSQVFLEWPELCNAIPAVEFENPFFISREKHQKWKETGICFESCACLCAHRVSFFYFHSPSVCVVKKHLKRCDEKNKSSTVKLNEPLTLNCCVFRITSTRASEMPTADSYSPSRSDLLDVERNKPGITERGCVRECFRKNFGNRFGGVGRFLCCFSVLCDFFRHIFLLMGQCRSFSWTSEWETYSEVSVIAVENALICDDWCWSWGGRLCKLLWMLLICFNNFANIFCKFKIV